MKAKTLILILSIFYIFECCNTKEEKVQSKSLSNKNNLSVAEAESYAKQYLNSSQLIHDIQGLDFYSNLSDQNNGAFTFYGSVCYGSSNTDCEYQNIYVITKNNGGSWEIEF